MIGLIFLLIFVVFPIAELAVLIKLGGSIGWLPTIALMIGAGMAGAAVARAEGFKSAMRVRSQLAHGALPAAEMFDGLLIAGAGLLLILPGILSDILGLILLLPPTRKLVRQGIMHWARTRFRVVQIGEDAADAGPPRRGDQIIDARVIETRVID
jgi:UPF0716 family protein affecting phage T7 exclusion